MTNNIDFQNFVYINRDIDIDRKKYMENQFDKYSIKAQRFNAVSDNFDNYSSDWKHLLREEDYDGLFYENPLLSMGEIGCLLSHLEVLRLHGHKELIVCEDDLDISTSDQWNFKLSEFLNKLNENVEILQMVKFDGYRPINVKKLVIGQQNGGNWGTAAYYIKPSLSNKIVSDYYIDGKWQLTKIKCSWPRKTADAVLYSFDTAYTCTIFSLAQEGDSTINIGFNPSLSIAKQIHNYFQTNRVSLENYFDI